LTPVIQTSSPLTNPIMIFRTGPSTTPDTNRTTTSGNLSMASAGQTTGVPPTRGATPNILGWIPATDQSIQCHLILSHQSHFNSNKLAYHRHRPGAGATIRFPM